MFDSKTDIFQKLKRKTRLIQKETSVRPVFFQLNFDEYGAYLRVVDGSNKDVSVGYEYYSGSARTVLKSLETIRDRGSFRIDWERANDSIYLGDNDFLIEQLKGCDNLVDSGLNPVKFSDTHGKVFIQIEKEKEKKNRLAGRAIVSVEGEEKGMPVLVNESYVLVDRTLYPIVPLGPHFKHLSLFETLIPEFAIEKYLTLVFSYFPDLPVLYEDYRITRGSPKDTRATLIFEKVDMNSTLYLRVSPSLPGIEPDFLESYELTRMAALNELEKKIVVSEIMYGDINGSFQEVNRLLKKHKRNLKEDSGYIVDDNLFIVEKALAKEFIYQELPHLITRYTLLGAEKLKAFKVRAVTPKLRLALSHGIDFLEGDATLEIEGQVLSLFDALNQYKKNAYIQLNDGTHAIIDKNYIDKLKRLFKKQKEKVMVSFFDLPIVEELIDEKIAKETFAASREIFLGFNTLSEAEIPYPELRAELRGYQRLGYKWIHYLHSHKLGGCLADDMGLGKTIQAIAILTSVYPQEKQPSLIVMPKSLLFNWESEVKKFSPELTFYTYHGPNRSIDEALTKNLIFTTYATVRIDIKRFQEEMFHYIILDESQNIKNPNSQVSKAAMLLKSAHRLALSGTPIENNLGELYALFRFLNPSMFGSVDEFNRNYGTPVQKDDDKEALHELKKKIYPFILRRLKKDVLRDLPDKIEQILYVDMTDEQQVFYEQRRKYYYDSVRSQIAQQGIGKSQFIILQALSELRQIASIPEFRSDGQIVSPKREVLMERITDLVANNHKILVFANFLNALDNISEELDTLGIDYLVMTGATRERKELVEKFQNDEAYKVFLMTLKTGGLGINLTAADYIFIYDPWWNRAAENQAIDRTHRIGQDKTVFSYKLITRGTIEEKILELQKLKSELFDSLITSDGASIKSLDEKDVEFVLG
ncbi:MAG TPA: DEAD/DEAH box helicase [Thermodesulfovibrionia bacterium]|nr:DEAD/DEAH box helicase [Thermodesulfovibrionia bacterium]